MKTKGMKVINNELYIGEYKAVDLAKKFKTPLYVFDEENIRYKLDIFKNHFKSDKYKTLVVYASKAFICPYMLKLIDEYGFGIDSVSEGDLFQIHSCHFPMNRVVLHGNNKTPSELEYAIINNVGYIVVDNEQELDKLESLASKYNKDLNLLLRVNPGISAHTHEYIQTSLLNSKFGESIFDEKKIDNIVKKCMNSKHLNLLGFHSHIGSSICNPKYFKDATATMLDFIYSVSKRNNTKFSVLNLGGGFGIKYLESDNEINLPQMLDTITSTVDEFIKTNDFGLKQIMIEPGRSIVGDSGSTLYTVGGYKNTYGGKKYVFVDGGMTDNIRPALYQAKYTVDICNRMENEEKELVDVVGPCCESGDIVVSDFNLGKVYENDTLITYCTGAYGYTMNSNYNSRLKGAVIFVDKDKITTGIKREEFNDLLRQYPVTTNKKIFDCHSDMLFDLWTSKCRGIDNRFNNYHKNQLNNSVVKGSIWTMYSPFDFDLIEACKIALNEIDFKGLRNFKVVLGIEGFRNLKCIEDLDVLYKMGFRHAMLTWNEQNEYATGAKADPNRGLTEKGKKLLKRMEELDMIIDLAHTNEKTFYDILKVTHHNIIYSHGNCRSLCGHVRNVTDDQMRALKEVDGLLGLTLASSFIDPDDSKVTMDKYKEHIKHAIDIMGIDNVCFGFDFMDYLAEFPNENLECVNNATLTYRIIEALEEIGLTSEEIDKVCWKNFYDRYKDKIWHETGE